MPRDVALLMLIAAIILAIVVGVAWRRRDRAKVTVWEWQAGLLFRDGRFACALPAGRHAPGRGGYVATVSLNPRITVVSGQEALTRDGFAVRLSATLLWRVTDARRFHASSNGIDVPVPEALHAAAQTALRAVIAGTDLDGLLSLRAEGAPLRDALRAPVAEAAASLGAEVESVVLRDLHLPAEVRRMVTEVERARREGLAALERARGEGGRCAPSPMPRGCCGGTRNSRRFARCRRCRRRRGGRRPPSSSVPARSCRWRRVPPRRTRDRTRSPTRPEGLPSTPPAATG